MKLEILKNSLNLFQLQKKRSRLRDVIVTQLKFARANLVSAFLCTLGFSLLTLLLPWPLKLIFDHILIPDTQHTLPTLMEPVLYFGKEWGIVILSASIVIIALFRGLFSYYQSFLTSRVGYNVVFTLRKELFSHLQKLSLSYHAKNKSGEIVSKLTQDTNMLKDVFAESVLIVITHVMTILGMFIIMFIVNWQLSLILILTFPLLFAFLMRLFGNIKKSVRLQRIKDGKIASRIGELLTIISLIKAYGRQQYESEKFDHENDLNLRESIRGARFESAITRVTEIITAFSTAVVVLFGSIQVLRNNMQAGDVLVFMAYVTSIYKPIRQIAKLSTKFSRAAVSIERLKAILDVDPDQVDKTDAVEAPKLNGNIQFENIRFAYDRGTKFVIDNVSFSIKSGEKVALVGESGAGKSTIANMLLRLYEPLSGSIFVDGVNMQTYTCDSLRSQIGIVMQDSMLFGSSIRENIAYGKLDATNTEIIAAAKLAMAHSFIESFPNGYETVIGERGCTLSGGQRQRLSLARVIIKDPEVIIMDEPTSGLDSETDSIIMESLRKIYAHKTVLLIAHRFSALKHFDKIIVLQKGKIVEQGSHQQLVSLKGYYYSLYSRQSLQ